MKAFYSDTFVLPLPEGHRFPMDKYARLVDRVRESLVPPIELIVPELATDAELLRAHDAEYLADVTSGSLSDKAVRRIGFPWSPEMVERSRRSCGATAAAARIALDEGCAINLGGGTHHAGRGHGEGFCVFNDAAVALLAVRAEGRIARAVVIDCDVHQGNGTAEILADDPSLFTFSIHGARNFPLRKTVSDLDVPLDDDTDDAAYLSALESGVADALGRARPELAVYIAGADPFDGDRLGRLSLTRSGLAARDRLVLGACRAAGVPVVVLMGGGYADVEVVVDIHMATVAAALDLLG